MTSAQALTLYSGAILVGALGGALVPLFAPVKDRLTSFLSFAGGVMFGAAFFHMLPEAFHAGGYSAFSFVVAGFILLYLLERYVLVHACAEPPDEAITHAHGSSMGLTAFLGLSVHTLFDGIALGSAVGEGVGLMAFTAIVAHKIPSSISLAAILKFEGKKRGPILIYVALFGLMVPLGVLLFLALDSYLGLQRFTGAALAFSSGTFLYIAASDLLPHVHRHGDPKRLSNVLSLVLGLLMMFALTWLGDHSH